MPKIAEILTIALFVQSNIQSYDWAALFNELMSKEPSIHVAAEERLFNKVLPDLTKRKPEELAPELLSLERVAEEGESYRLGASSLLLALAVDRHDTAIAFQPIIPHLIRQFKDQNDRIRRNAVNLIVNLEPDVPESAVRPLTEMLADTDEATLRGAILGLARVCKNSLAVETVAGLLDSVHTKSQRLAALEGVGTFKCVNEGIYNRLGRMLKETDREIVLQTINAIGKLGTDGRELKSEVDFVAEHNPDQEISKAASLAATRLK